MSKTTPEGKVMEATITFRTGQKMVVYAESIVYIKGKNSPYNQLHLDGVPVASFNRGSPNFNQQADSWSIYNGGPLPALYEMMPDDWDKTQPALKIINEVVVNTIPQPKREA